MNESYLSQSEERNYLGLVIFFIREKALEFGLEDTIINLLSKEGFNILKMKTLNSQERENCKCKVRGGYWGRGRWEKSGGGPAMIVVAYDLLPIPPNSLQKVKHPNLDNARIRFKTKIREEVKNYLSPSEECNLLHSSDNGLEAWNILKIILPDELDDIENKINELRDCFKTNQTVHQDLTRYGRRSKVEVIEYNGALAVKKTFRPGCEKFFKRELFVLRELSHLRSEIPPLLESGKLFVIIPYYKDTLNFKVDSRKRLPLKIVKQAMEVLYFFYELGYALIDFHPGNLIIDSEEGLKIIDFEYLYKYQSKPKTFEKCYDLAGIPASFLGDKPLLSRDHLVGRSYAFNWEPYVGLDLKSLLNVSSSF